MLRSKMHRLLKTNIAFILISMYFGASSSTPIETSQISNEIKRSQNGNKGQTDNTIRVVERECILIEDCGFYEWFIDDGNYGVLGFPKEKVDAELKKHQCGLDKKGNVERGK